jgi:hypothetical protein
MRVGTHTVRPELVEGHFFLLTGEEEGKGFDKLSPNGWGASSNGRWVGSSGCEPNDFLSARLVPIC